MPYTFDNSYARQLRGLYVEWQPQKYPDPRLLLFNDALARELGVDAHAARTGAADLLGGAVTPAGAQPLAQAYAGHQFGHLSPQLGDGRAILIGELVDERGQRRDLQLKGSGRTPFSRGGDGRAALGPVLREYLMGEAMHRLGVPTTRALAAITTGEQVQRDGPLPGAVLARVAASHLRVGTFEFIAIRDDRQLLRKLADYAVERHYPQHLGSTDGPRMLLFEVARAQAQLIARWMSIGFVHGVMNTDNVTVSGETIDYGPCAFMEAYDPATVFSSIDHGGRYSYGNQPKIGRWNIARFGIALAALLADDPALAEKIIIEAIESFDTEFEATHRKAMRDKLALDDTAAIDLVDSLLAQMLDAGADFTATFRFLAGHLRGEAPAKTERAAATRLEGQRFEQWAEQWRTQLRRQGISEVDAATAMDRVNPLYIPRNYMVEEALTAALEGELGPFESLMGVLKNPFTRREGCDDHAVPAPVGSGQYTTYCGT